MDVQYFCKRALQSCENYEMIWREMSTVVAMQIRVMVAGAVEHWRVDAHKIRRIEDAARMRQPGVISGHSTLMN
jgi:hypothetical protein